MTLHASTPFLFQKVSGSKGRRTKDRKATRGGPLVRETPSRSPVAGPRTAMSRRDRTHPRVGTFADPAGRPLTIMSRRSQNQWARNRSEPVKEPVSAFPIAVHPSSERQRGDGEGDGSGRILTVEPWANSERDDCQRLFPRVAEHHNPSPWGTKGRLERSEIHPQPIVAKVIIPAINQKSDPAKPNQRGEFTTFEPGCQMKSTDFSDFSHGLA